MQIKIEPGDYHLFATHILFDITNTVDEVASVIAHEEDEWPEAARIIKSLDKTLELLGALERAFAAARKLERAHALDRVP